MLLRVIVLFTLHSKAHTSQRLRDAIVLYSLVATAVYARHARIRVQPYAKLLFFEQKRV